MKQQTNSSTQMISSILLQQQVLSNLLMPILEGHHQDRVSQAASRI